VIGASGSMDDKTSTFCKKKKEVSLSYFILIIKMGNRISNVTAIAGIDSYVSELGDVYYEKR
jgi:hypothetical protein